MTILDAEDVRDEVSTESVGPTPEFEALLEYLKRSRGFDFSGYKRSSLVRRVDKQMQNVGLAEYADYVDYLEVHPDEFERLFDTILINVTAFFRDSPSWEYLAQEVIPRLLAAKNSEEPIRLWSAGCASGQEPYSLAILLAEALGLDAFRERVKIYATDVDEDALAQARAAAYTEREVQGIPETLRAKYFDLEGSRHVFHKDLRRGLIFGRHDLLRDAPISRIDLLVCRNTIMYFNAEAQAGILSRFHFALQDGGTLFLGKAEMLFSHGGLFLPLELKRRVFVKVPKSGLRDRLLAMAQAGPDTLETPADPQGRLREIIFRDGPLAQVVVDMSGALVMANEKAQSLFRLSPHDLGRPLRDLEISYRPVELRSCIERAYAERRFISVKEVPWTVGTERLFLDVQVSALQDDGALLGCSVTFTDVTRSRQLSEELQEANRELETAYEELQSINEELETTNEELQSTVEELETTNEELQSTNEELETTNEELQSTVEEVQTINGELRQRSMELNQVNAFLETILTSLRGGVIVLDRDLLVQIWNSKSQDLWGLSTEEVQGKAFLTLDIGLPIKELIQPVRACLSGSPHQELRVEARNRRGRSFSCQVTLTPLGGQDGEHWGVILLMEERTSE